MAGDPAHLVFALAPHDRGTAAVGEDHDEGREALRTGSDVERGPDAPVALRLGAGRRLDAAVRADRRPAEACADVAQDRLVGPAVAVRTHEVVVQLVHVDRALAGVGRAPGVDRVRERGRREHLVLAAVDGAFTGTTQVVTHRALRDPELARNGSGRNLFG